MSNGEPQPMAEEACVQISSSPPNSRSCCFCFPCFSGCQRSSSGGLALWEHVRTTSWSQTHQSEEQWWSRGIGAFMKVREWSEIVAGPKWKTFLRRFNRTKSGRPAKFQYDPLSYALNFDEGPGQNGSYDEDDYDGFRNFSTRYATVPGPNQVKLTPHDSVKTVE